MMGDVFNLIGSLWTYQLPTGTVGDSNALLARPSLALASVTL